MNKQFMIDHSKLVHRSLSIMSMYSDYKINEIQQNFNRCYKCENSINNYSVNEPPRINSHAWGDSPHFFTCNGSVWWSITCSNCNEKIPIVVSYEYDINSGCIVKSFDFFMDERYDCGHYNETPSHL